jgi:hypothetical protein
MCPDYTYGMLCTYNTCYKYDNKYTYDTYCTYEKYDTYKKLQILYFTGMLADLLKVKSIKKG